MTDNAHLDPAVRARLEAAKDWLRREEEDPEYIQLGADIEALLAAYDAAVAERDARRGPCEVCWTVSWAPTPDGEHCAHCELTQALRTTAAELATAETERGAMRAAVAAARAWRGSRGLPFEAEAAAQLDDAVAALPAEGD